MSGLDINDPDFFYLVVDRKKLMAEQKGKYDTKTSCWVADKEDGFLEGEVLSREGDKATVKILATNVTKENMKEEDVQQMNPPKYKRIDDMANMTFLNEACVLYNLKDRYEAGLIYTYSGLFCIAVNPYRRDLGLYTQKVIDAYKGRRPTEMPPHLFMVADKAYQAMLQDRENQSCLITGESGAGKTENTKKVIMYLANIAAAAAKEGDEDKGSLEDQIIQCNPVMEAYGNATTTRNNNSSRFGKFIRIHFGTSGKIAGADIEHYLLEKSRVTYCQPAERNYHIFYQLLSPAIPEICKLILAENDPGLYAFTNLGRINVDGIDDIQEMKDTDHAFNVLGFTEQEKSALYKCTGALIHMGEMKFKQRGEQAESDGTAEGEKVAFLMGINAGDLLKGLMKPKVKVGTEFVVKGQTLAQVTYSTQALAKSIYERMFGWLVKRCNKTLDTNNKRQSFIGVLDIAGFEIFDFNTFEQLCINYTNERLQQFFNHHMFILEQEEYKKEGIEWEFINFGMDLQASIDLIEKPMGLLSTLEEQCMFPKATDKTFIDALNNAHLGKSKAYGKPCKPRGNQGEAHFELFHYAGVVRYSIASWLEKNKDPLNETVVALLMTSKEALVQTFFQPPPEAAGGGGKKKKSASFQTISSVHKASLNALMKSLYSTHPHFVRCIVPNEKKQPGLVEANLVMHQLQCNGVLEGIRICRKGFPSRIVYPEFKQRYSICAPNAIPEGFVDGKKVTGNILEALELDPTEYKLGITKVFFKAGVLGTLEEMREERLSKIISMLQSFIRGYLMRKDYKKLCDQRTGLELIQKNVRCWMGLKNWSWWRLFVKVKPLLNVAAAEDEMKIKEAEMAKQKEEFDKMQQNQKDLESQAIKYLQAKNDMTILLQTEQDALCEAEEQIELMIEQKIEMQEKMKEMEDRLLDEEDAGADAADRLKKLESDNKTMKEDLEDLENVIAKADQENKSKDNKIKTLEDEMANQDDSIAKFTKDKKNLEEENKTTSEALQAEEDKVNHLNKLKTKLESTLDELEDNLEREKKMKADVEKAKKKLEGDLKATQEIVEELENLKAELEGNIKKKDMEINSTNGKLEDEQTLASTLQKKIKEQNGRIEEIEEELENERSNRQKAEKQRGELTNELEDLSERLDEAGGATAAQIELNKRREAELMKLKRDLEETAMQSEAAIASMKKKGQDAINEMSDQVEQLQKVKSKLDKEKNQFKAEMEDLQSQLEHASKNKGMSGEMQKKVEAQINEINSRLDQANRENGDLQTAKNRASAENSELTRQLEEAEHRVGALTKEKKSLESRLDEATRQLEDETRSRQKLSSECRSLSGDLDALREQLEEEQEGRADCQRNLSKASAEVQQWRVKWETEGTARGDELEEAKRKLTVKLADAETAAEAAMSKVSALEKAKSRLTGELEDAIIEAERSSANATNLEKRQRAFDKTIGEWKTKCNGLQSECESAQKDSRAASAEVYRLKARAEESNDAVEAMRRENKNLADEIHDLTDQLGSEGRSTHELEKSRKRVEMEKEELQSALEEAESQLEQEEAKVMRAQLEVSAVRSDIDRRIQDKEEEFDNTRRMHQRAIESVQLSLESESRGKSEALRIKKKLEQDINELEVALDQANRGKADFEKNVKKFQQTIREMQGQIEDESRARDEARESYNSAERRCTVLSGEVDELRTSLEQADRARKGAENELNDACDRVNELAAQAASVGGQKRKLEGDIMAMQTDLDEMSNELRSSDERAKKAMGDAARLGDELRQEQEHNGQVEKMRKNMEISLKDMQVRLEEAEAQALKGGKKIIQKLEVRVRELEAELDNEQRRHAETQKNMRKADRRLKELAFQSDEDSKNHTRLQDMVDKLSAKIKTYKGQVEEAEEIASVNLAKFRKVQNELEDAEERADFAESALNKSRALNRSSVSQARNSVAPE